MTVICHEKKLKIVRLELDECEISKLIEKFYADGENREPADRHEKTACELESAGFPEERSVSFAEDVIRWGKGHRFVQRFRQQNTPASIASALKKAVRLTDENCVPAAVDHMTQLRYLGQSFGSKMVRVLRPCRAVILDSVLRNNLGYSDDKSGYGAFLDDCHTILDAVRGKYPKLRVCDVETAIYAKVQTIRRA